MSFFQCPKNNTGVPQVGSKLQNADVPLWSQPQVGSNFANLHVPLWSQPQVGKKNMEDWKCPTLVVAAGRQAVRYFARPLEP